ncbi:unnamed protein product, partial [Nesidiocoris tenuis]
MVASPIALTLPTLAHGLWPRTRSKVASYPEEELFQYRLYPGRPASCIMYAVTCPLPFNQLLQDDLILWFKVFKQPIGIGNYSHLNRAVIIKLTNGSQIGKTHRFITGSSYVGRTVHWFGPHRAATHRWWNPGERLGFDRTCEKTEKLSSTSSLRFCVIVSSTSSLTMSLNFCFIVPIFLYFSKSHFALKVPARSIPHEIFHPDFISRFIKRRFHQCGEKLARTSVENWLALSRCTSSGSEWSEMSSPTSKLRAQMYSNGKLARHSVVTGVPPEILRMVNLSQRAPRGKKVRAVIKQAKQIRGIRIQLPWRNRDSHERALAHSAHLPSLGASFSIGAQSQEEWKGGHKALHMTSLLENEDPDEGLRATTSTPSSSGSLVHRLNPQLVLTLGGISPLLKEPNQPGFATRKTRSWRPCDSGQLLQSPVFVSQYRGYLCR